MPPTVHIPVVCHENWEAMTPNGPGRFCDQCQTTVADLTTMGPSQANRFLKQLPNRLANGEHLCVRAHAGPDGHLVPTSRSRRLLNNGMAAMLAMTMAGYAGSGPTITAADGPVDTTIPCPPATTPEIQGDVMIVGEIAPAPTATPAAVSATAQRPALGTPSPAPQPQPLMGISVVPPAVSATAPAPLLGKPASH